MMNIKHAIARAVLIMAVIVLPSLAQSGSPLQPDRVSSRGNFGMDPKLMPVSYEYYDLDGRDHNSLVRQMDQRGPTTKTGGGQKALGLTEWRIKWGMQFSYNQNKICTRFETQVTGSIKFTMPRWTHYAEGSAKLKKRWDRLYQALQIHEDGHALHGVNALKEVMQLKPKLSPARTCESIQKDFSAKASAIIQKYHQKDVDYDRETRHGITQGTVF